MIHYIWQEPDWPHFRWQSDLLLGPLGKARLRQGKLLGEMSGLGFNLGLETRCEILIEETIQTAAIEGEQYERQAVRSSIARRLGMPAAALPRADRHADGLVDVLLDATGNFNSPLTVNRLHGWQAALFPTGYSGLRRIAVGKFRHGAPMQVVSGPIGQETVHYEAPPSRQVGREIDLFLKWWDESRGHIDGLLRAGIAHLWFVTIHPYDDGNGRLARAITDMALAGDEKNSTRFYSLSAQIMAEREGYYHILEQTQRGDLDITPWLAWFLACFTSALDRSYAFLDITLQKARFWKIHTKPLAERQRKVVNKLLDAGPGGFAGGLTTRKYVSMAKVGRATAYREISDLLAKGLLSINQGKGRSVSYDLIWPE